MKWINVKDRLPEDEKCLFYTDVDISMDHFANEIISGDYDPILKEFADVIDNVVFKLNEVTHWMLQPKPPK